MKKTLLIVFIIISNLSFSQNKDKVNYFKFKSDSVLLYLDKQGNITVESKAKLYRKAQLDKNSFSYVGKVEDYYIDNNRKAYQCFYELGYLTGEVKCFFRNGRVKYQGFYKNSLKDSVWNFYYDNGMLEKAIIYKADTMYLKEYYKKNGAVVFSNGNGKYKGTVISSLNDTTEYTVTGNIKNGKFDGKWIWSNNWTWSKEYFNNGVFVNGISPSFKYDTNPIVSVTGFNLHENINIYRFIAIPNGYHNTYLFRQLLKFNNSSDLNKTFTPIFTDKLLELNIKYNISNYWCLIQLIINKENNIQFIDAYSNNDLVSSNIKQFLSSLTGFETAKPDDNNVDCTIFISLFCENGKINIPVYTFDSEFDIINLIPNK